MAYNAEKIAETLAVLDANAGNVTMTSHACGVGRATIQRWRDERHAPDTEKAGGAQKRAGKRRDLAEIIEDIVYGAAEIVPGKLEGADLRALMTTIGIGVEKMRLLRGESTERTEEVTVRRVNAVPREYADRHHLDRNGHDK